MTKPVLVSGIKPEGPLHVGNFFGSLNDFIKLQNSGGYDCYFFVADLHSLTEEFNPKKKYSQIMELVAEYAAAGLDPKRSVLFQQSLIPAHAELAWILTVITPEGELRRMTQYKDKVVMKKLEANAGLLMYPVLMAADILLYDAALVPVGDDQDQHLELARTLARKFNAKFGTTFIEPRALHTHTPRVMSLKNPEKKMSKSDPDGCLFIDDEPGAIKTKIMRAVTDSGSKIRYDKKKKPGVSNLLELYAALADTPIKNIERRFKGKGYGELKSNLATRVAEHFTPFRKKKKALLARPAALKEILCDGSARAGKIAAAKMEEVKKRTGLLW